MNELFQYLWPPVLHEMNPSEFKSETGHDLDSYLLCLKHFYVTPKDVGVNLPDEAIDYNYSIQLLTNINY